MVVRPALLYGAECWPIKKSQVQRMKVAEMRMIRWMCSCTRLDKIGNEMIRSKIGITSIKDKMTEARLGWFEHIRRKPMDVPVRRGETIVCFGQRSHRGRPRKSWREVIRHDLKSLGLVEGMAHDRKLWRGRIQVTDS